MSTTTLLRSGVVVGWIVLAAFAVAMGVMVVQAAHTIGFGLPSLQAPTSQAHALGQLIGHSLVSRLGIGGGG